MKTETNIMIDIETLDTKSTATILSIGAAEFDIVTGEIGLKFYKAIRIDSSNKRSISAETVAWWMTQGDKAKEVFKDPNALELVEALLDLMAFFTDRFGKVNVWANSPSFDLAILRNAYEQHSLSTPWKFWQERDVRTLVAFMPDVKDLVVKEFEGTHHNALDDCILQAKYCSEIYKTITNA